MLWIGLVLLVAMSGCIAPMSATEALLLSEEDVEQAVKLREARDGKTCIRVDGTLSHSSMFSPGVVNARVEVITALGKNVTFAACKRFYQPRTGVAIGGS